MNLSNEVITHLFNDCGFMYFPTPEWKAFSGWLGTTRAA